MSDVGSDVGSELIDMPKDVLITPFQHVYHIHDEDGYVVWRRASGNNVELLHIRSSRSGGGTALLLKMLKELLTNPPYATVFGFARVSNIQAREFYQRVGFTCSCVTGVYSEGSATIFSARYDDLCRIHGVVL